MICSRKGKALFEIRKLASAVVRFLCFTALLLAISLSASAWRLIGPSGGNVRSLAYDPGNPNHVLLGTSTGQIFTSQDAGDSWELLAHFSLREDYVIDHIVFDPKSPTTIYAGGWGLFHDTEGDVFRSDDGGHTWRALKGVHDKSIRALAMARSDHNTLVIGAQDGVFRSHDGGTTWVRMTPENPPVMENYSSMKNFVSVAIDPRNPDIVYAGTRHLAWKTADGGLHWHNITEGMVEDSDVFSIIVDPNTPSLVYASACSGIYKSDDAAELFHRIEGLPQSAIRTRVLKQDPERPSTVYAGTTGGLWKTLDFGASWSLVSSPDLVVNDVLIDPRNPDRVLLATDSLGVLISNDGFAHYAASNRGFSLRMVGGVIVDRQDPNRLYAGVANAGVFVSDDAGENWRQFSRGLSERDILSLQQAENGVLVAGTNQGIFYMDSNSGSWQQASMYQEAVPQRQSEKQAAVSRRKGHSATKNSSASKLRIPVGAAVLEATPPRVRSIQLQKTAWYAATSEGLFISVDQGRKWYGQSVSGEHDFSAVNSYEDGTLTLVSHRSAYVSRDKGQTWTSVALPHDITDVYNLTLLPDSSLWLGSHAGALRSIDEGETWQHMLGGLPEKDVLAVRYDAGSQRLLATALYEYGVFESKDNGKTWQKTPNALVSIRWAISYQGHLLAVSTYNGLLLEQSGDPTSATNQVPETSSRENKAFADRDR